MTRKPRGKTWTASFYGRVKADPSGKKYFFTESVEGATYDEALANLTEIYEVTKKLELTPATRARGQRTPKAP